MAHLPLSRVSATSSSPRTVRCLAPSVCRVDLVFVLLVVQKAVCRALYGRALSAPAVSLHAGNWGGPARESAISQLSLRRIQHAPCVPHAPRDTAINVGVKPLSVGLLRIVYCSDVRRYAPCPDAQKCSRIYVWYAAKVHFPINLSSHSASPHAPPGSAPAPSQPPQDSSHTSASQSPAGPAARSSSSEFADQAQQSPPGQTLNG